MKKNIQNILIGVLAASMMLTFAACSKSGDSTEGHSDSDADKGASVELGSYTGLTATKKIYTVSQDAIDETIQSDLDSIASQNDISGPSEEGNCMSLLFTISVDGEVVEDYGEEGYDITLGECEYGEDFDAALTGLKAGDKFDFSIPYDDSTAQVTGTVNSVYELIKPEYNKDAVKELGFDSIEKYEEDVKEQLMEQYEEESEYELTESIYSQIIEASTFSNTKSMLNDYFEEYVTSYTDYAAMFGMEYSEMLDTFGMTEDDIKDEAEQAMKKALVVKAIAEKEGLSVSDDDFEQIAQASADSEGYEDVESYIADYGEDNIKLYMLEDLVSDFLIGETEITEVKADYTAE